MNPMMVLAAEETVYAIDRFIGEIQGLDDDGFLNQDDISAIETLHNARTLIVRATKLVGMNPDVFAIKEV